MRAAIVTAKSGVTRSHAAFLGKSMLQRTTEARSIPAKGIKWAGSKDAPVISR